MTPDPLDPFIPISPNPYIVGNPVRDRSMFFGREAEFDLVKRRFAESRATGGLLVFCGERRSGKTSILFQIDQGRLGTDFVPVLIDMQSMAVESEENFLLKLARLILERVGPVAGASLTSIEGSRKPAAAFLEIVQTALTACPGKKLILLFDEYELFEAKIKDGVLSDDVLHAIAHLTENRSVFLVFTGSMNLEERHQEYWKVFLGRSTFRKISFLDRRDAVSLITEPVRGRVDFEDGVVESIYRLTAGQPFYTQAVCQSLVDRLNEQKTAQATQDILRGVVEGIVDQPFPQMTFRWEGLEAKEKLVLALLAETLPDVEATASVQDVLRSLARGRYPLPLGEAEIATTLENLFQQEILLVFESEKIRSYAFRFDLWRHWIRRMHTVWQVMRELGMEIRSDHRRKRRVRLLAGAGAVLVVGIGLIWGFWNPRPRQAVIPPSGNLTIRTNTADAQISVDGQLAGLGVLSKPFPAGDHHILITREGYRSDSLTVSLGSGVVIDTTVILTPLLGDLLIRTFPAGATVFVNGEPRGRSPARVTGLPANQAHEVRVELAGYEPQTRPISTLPDTLIEVDVPLIRGNATLVIQTEPTGAELYVDDQPTGSAPRTLLLALGPHRIRADAPGFVPRDTLYELQATGSILLELRKRPKGWLRITGDKYATMYVADEKVQPSHTRWEGRAFEEGDYELKIVFDDTNLGERNKRVPVKSGRMTVYNYSLDQVSFEPLPVPGERP